MKRLIFSDFHIGNPLFKDVYIKSIKQIFKDNIYDEIIINGDIIDIWENSKNKILYEYEPFIKFINERAKYIPIYIICGNHDPDFDSMNEIFNSCIVKQYSYSDSKSIFIHGHEFDYLILNYSYIIRFLNYFCIGFEKIGIDIKSFFREYLYSVSMKRSKAYYSDLVLDIEKDAVLKYCENYQNIILGHTHFPKITKINSLCQYINSGDIIHNNSYVVQNDNYFELKFI